MEYKKFKDLLNKGECKTVDYKIECNAFTKGNEGSKAELVKDIISFANNGNIKNYLIIGVSDDRNGFKSVDNYKLTDDNLQILCKDYIFPVPKVKLIDCYWKNASDERHKDKRFIIIQVGPQARQCFRFNRDFINYEKRYCFKKNEVWIRREATSDLALPEEIKRLLEGKEPITESALDNSTDYKRLPKNEYKQAVFKDLHNFIINLNGTLEEEKTQFGNEFKDSTWRLLTININNQKLKVVVLIIEKLNKKDLATSICKRIPLFHHGVLILSLGNITPSSMESSHLKIKDSWGWFFTNYKTRLGKIIKQISRTEDHFNMGYNETFCLALEKINTTEILYAKLQKAVDTMIGQEDVKSYIKTIYSTINISLDNWRLNECVIATDNKLSDYYIKKISDGKQLSHLKPNEFVDLDRYGNVIMKKMIGFCKLISKFID